VVTIEVLFVTIATNAVERALAWVRPLIQDDGSLRGATALDHYYKAPCALAFAGEPEAAHRVLDYALRRFTRADGTLDGTGVAWFDRFRIYPAAWLLWASVELDAPAEALARHLLTQQNAASGGFYADAQGTEEIMTTSLAGLALLRYGRVDEARAAGAWLERVLNAQPDLRSGLTHVWRHPAGLDVGDGSVWFRVDASQPRQWYFQYGISAALLADLARATGEREWLQLAQRYLRASGHCYEDRYATPQSGKIGWGAAWTHALSGDAADLALVDAVAAGLAALQGADGSWNAEGVYDAAPPAETMAARLDVTLEFLALLSLMRR